jgi:hypothetical protein
MVDYRLIFARSALAAAGMAGSFLLASGGTAEAQFFGWWNQPTAPAYGGPVAAIPPGEIYRIVASRGYQVTGGLRSNGRVYMVDVIDRWGRPLRLVVDAYDGDIVQSFATRVPRPAAPIPQPQPLLGELFAPQAPAAYPPYPGTAPAAREQTKVPGLGQPAQVERRKPARKTQTATRETGSATTGAVPMKSPVHADVPTTSRPATTRTEAEPSPAESVVPKAPAVGTPPKTDKVTATAAPNANSPAATVAKPVPAPKPAPAKGGPGYANGVPINPLD